MIKLVYLFLMKKNLSLEKGDKLTKKIELANQISINQKKKKSEL